jgi:predicted Zn-dependent protease
MKHWIALTGIVLLGLAAVVISERRKVDAPVGPEALLYLVGDTEQELTRMPVRFTRMSDEEEIRIGNDLARNYKRDEKPSEDTLVVEKYLDEVGARLASHAHRHLPYRFHYVPEKYFFNAFALPGGHVYIGQGLLALMDSEDELAAVLGHEIEHIDHYHCAERVQQERALRKIPLGGLFAIPIEVFEAGYSKDQELEADREGTRLAVAAGYSPNGAIRMFETFQRLYDQTHNKASNPGEELSQVAQQALEGYFRSHPLPAERIAQVQNLIATEHWRLHAERDLAVGYIFWTAKASDLLQAGKYAQAQQLALQSLKVKPDQAPALEVLAKAQFAQADFGASAETYRQLIALNRYNLGFADAYARALAAADRGTAAGEFRSWVNSIGAEENWAVKVPLAGLSLLAGDPSAARDVSRSATNDLTQDWAPGALLDLGWWHYMAGDYTSALYLISDAVQQRPGNANYTTKQGWVQIEQHTLADSLQSLGKTYDSGETPERQMARAVALWQARRQHEAMANFEAAAGRQPEWENPRWVKALYSPGVGATIAQMKAEREKRQRAEKRPRNQ